jgi:hypothetical protein
MGLRGYHSLEVEFPPARATRTVFATIIVAPAMIENAIRQRQIRRDDHHFDNENIDKVVAIFGQLRS